MKVSQAKGMNLDKMVAAASGKKFTTSGWAPVMIPYETESVRGWEEFNPSTKWEQGGPLIQEAGISISYLRQYNRWVAMSTEGEGTQFIKGDTPLEAAMRCYVQIKLGSNVNMRKLAKGFEDQDE